jgi:branched-chain amino acid transport system ATP-binding protein
MTGPLLRLENVTKRFGGVVAVNDLSLEVASGELLGVIGPNGAGKSTLLSLIGGAQKPSSGQIWFRDERVSRQATFRTARMGIARAHQIPRPFRGMTVRDNLMVAADYAGVRANGVRGAEHVGEVLRRCGLEASAARQAGSLTLLELKRLEVARTLALKPDLLLLDEVGAGLVGGEIDEITELVRGVHADGVTIVLVEHVQALVQALAQRVVVLDWGKKFAEGTAKEIAENPEVVRIYFGSGGDGVAPELADRAVPAAVRDAVLRVEGLSVDYGKLPALRSVDVELGAGEVVAVLGANGAGKSSLARGICGIAPTSGGRILLDGEDITAEPAHLRSRRGLALCHEGRRLFGEMSVRENLELAAAYAARSTRSLDERLAEVVELFPVIADKLDQPAGALSGGQQQMVAISRALMSEPRILIFDELSLGLAPAAIDDIFAALDPIRAAGIGVLLIEQNVFRSLAVADRAYVLERGVVSFSGTPAELAGDERLRTAYFGAAA